MHRLNITAWTLAGMLMVWIPGQAATPAGQPFPSPDAAAKALVEAARNNDVASLISILGPSSKDILQTKDAVADRKTRREFAERAAEKMKLVPYTRQKNAKAIVAGKNEWPMPIPIVQSGGDWYFDVAKGKREILMRRIGGNELDAIDVCRGYVEAQNDYAELTRTGSAGSHYALKIISTPGMRDGLYWPAGDDKEESPIGDLIARAFAEGYTNKKDPFHGYYFKVLTGQGPHHPGGAKSYLDNGVMTRGFALIAWPSDYRSTGIMTFLVDKTGIVYQKDLGKKTAEIAAGMTVYDPDATWTPVGATSHP